MPAAPCKWYSGNPCGCALDRSLSGSSGSAPTSSLRTSSHTYRASCPEPVDGGSRRFSCHWTWQLPSLACAPRIHGRTVACTRRHRGARSGRAPRASGSEGEAPHRLGRGPVAGTRTRRAPGRCWEPGICDDGAADLEANFFAATGPRVDRSPRAASNAFSQAKEAG